MFILLSTKTELFIFLQLIQRKYKIQPLASTPKSCWHGYNTIHYCYYLHQEGYIVCLSVRLTEWIFMGAGTAH